MQIRARNIKTIHAISKKTGGKMKEILTPELQRLDLLMPEQLLAIRIQTFTPEEVAPIFGVSTDTLRSWMKHGKLNIGVADKKDTSECKYNFTIFRPHLERCIQGLLI